MHLPSSSCQLNHINPNEANLFGLGVSFLSFIELLRTFIRLFKLNEVAGGVLFPFEFSYIVLLLCI